MVKGHWPPQLKFVLTWLGSLAFPKVDAYCTFWYDSFLNDCVASPEIPACSIFLPRPRKPGSKIIY